MTISRTLLAAASILVVALLAGCGSILSSSEITAARGALERAADAGASETALYEYTSAEAYLEKAREEWGRSDFQHAVDYARLSRTFAGQALERATRGRRMTPAAGDAALDAELDALDTPTR